MRIPTLLGLIVLSLLIIAGIGAKIYWDNKLILRKEPIKPQKIDQSNLTSTSITITFWTDDPTTTQVLYSSDQNLITNLKIAADDRDNQPTLRNLHFATLSDLVPETTYFFKVKIGPNTYPSQPLSFKTPANNPTSESLLPPLIGSVIDTNLNSVSEALVTLSVTNYLPLSSLSDSKGGFVLSLKPLYKTDNLAEVLKLPTSQDAQLIISKGNQASQVEIRLNQTGKLLPPIILGQNLDLRDYVASIEATPKQASPSSQIYDFDVNGDGKVNAADVTIVLNNLGRKNPTNPKADINKDGVVDQKDLDLIKGALPKN